MIKRITLFLFVALGIFAVLSCFNNPSTNDDPVNPITDKSVDSLFAVLVTKVDSLEDIEDYDDFYALEFATIRDGFKSFLTSKPNHIKVNTGYIVASVLALNKSAKLKMLADSLDAYFNSLEKYEPNLSKKRGVPFVNGFLSSRLLGSKKESHLMRNALDKHGVNGLGVALAARTPEIIASQYVDPSFPRFLTISFLQGIAQNEIIPVIDSVIAAFGRLEAIDTMQLIFTIEGEEVEVDLGDVYIVDAGIRLLRAQLLMLCTYDMDVFTSAPDQSYSWIDKIEELVDKDTVKNYYTLVGDTITKTSVRDETELMLFMCDVAKYNMSDRSAFMKIKNTNHAKAHSDYLAVPDLIKSGITYIRNENDNQNNDVIPKVEIDDITGEMADLRQEMLNEGFSETLANNFQTPETFMAFVKTVLSGPYTINETIDSVTVNITIDLSKFFTAPVQDLKTFLPLHKWRAPASRVQAFVDDGPFEPLFDTTYFNMYKYDDEVNIIAFDSSKIDSIVDMGWEYRVYMNTAVRALKNIDSNIVAIPLDITNAAGTIIPFEDIPDLIDAQTFLPYFSDYTFNGIFVGMTRQKWLDLIYQ